VAPQIFLTDDADSEDRSMTCGTAIAESGRCTTAQTESKLSVTDAGTDKELKYRLQMSLEDAPLVNITDNVVHSVNDSMSVSVADVDTADISFINITLQKSILIPLKIQVCAFPLIHFLCHFSINISLTLGAWGGVLVGWFRDRFPVVSLDFSVTYSFRPYRGPGVDSAPSENEYQEHFLGVKAAGAWG